MHLSEQNKTLSIAAAQANNKIGILSSKVLALESITEKSWNANNLWVDDYTVKAYFEAMSSTAINNDEIIFLEPSQTHLLKLSKDNVCEVFPQFSSPMLRFIFCCLSNSVSSNEDSGSHWSLLFCDMKASKGFHFDSMSGSNVRSAKLLAKRLKILKGDVIEMPSLD